MTPFTYALCSLATFCIALFITKTEGPMFIFRKLRAAPPKGSSARVGLSCLWCSATWIAAAITAFEFWRCGWLNWLDFPIYWFAITAGAIVLNQAFTKG